MTKRLPNAAQAAATKAECARKRGKRVEAKQGSADALRSLRRIRRRVDRKLNWRRTPGETDVIPTLFRMRYPLIGVIPKNLEAIRGRIPSLCNSEVAAGPVLGWIQSEIYVDLIKSMKFVAF
ncbi:hypothetical protein [Variovorax paradoxus]|uniref:hypothetical protein n=1 Tax=Variovorax paradoxus TaxID=34073 RepID=UPI002854799D|nr:hypothetical protein [Variovorax paradoxus]MDR6455089.1 hypothetical protein [Variovorax paradoxus]